VGKLLLHVCCAPDATYGVEHFGEHWDVTLFFHNPNVEPEEEYELRAVETRRLAHRMGIPLIVGPYDVSAWPAAVRANL
jgi:hypothetical protein